MKTFSMYRLSIYKCLQSALLLIAALFVPGSVSADDISLEQALQIARRFSVGTMPSQVRGRRIPSTQMTPKLAYSLKSRVAAGKDNVYVINYGNDQGFAIVSGENGTEGEVLGYCDHGSFDYDNCPVQLKDLLAYYSNAIDSLRQDPKLAVDAKKVKGKGVTVVGPLLTTRWSQWAPYNNQCPSGCPSGCFPTAIAQVMNYWKWPKASVGEVNGEDFSGHVYDWDNMLDEYNWWDGYTAEQANAVAKLMADIGKAFGTVYRPEGSPTGFTDYPLKENFHYKLSPSAPPTGKTAAELQEVMMAELDAKRPVLYCGGPMTSSEDCHALVCDGYTSTGFFHFNYGWGGICDGFYKHAIIPYYSDNATLIIGVHPYDAVVKTIGDFKYGLNGNGTADILDYTAGGFGKENGTLEIPSTVDDEGNTYRITRICQQAFYRKGHFDKIILSEDLDEVEPISFFYTKIDTLVLGDRLNAVPDQAFAYTDIRHLTIGENVRRIGKRAFYMCYLNQGIVCKSPAFEVDEEAFAITKPLNGDWIGRITKLGKNAFAGAQINRNNAWIAFTNLEEIEDSAFWRCSMGSGTPSFRLYSKVRKISASAFEEWPSTSVISVEDDNPYFSRDDNCNIYNKNMTSLVLLFRPPSYERFPSTLVRLEPGCFRPNTTEVIIPPSVVEMEGALKDCKANMYWGVTSMCVVPPVISDDSFNEEFLKNNTTLHVPTGTENLYRNAPGWRHFTEIVGDQEYVPMPDQDREYYMVVNSGGDGQQLNIPVSEVNSMEVSEDGQHLVVKRHGKDDLNTTVVSIDSITWKPGFVYGNAEVFNLNDSTLTAKAQKCSVQFDATVIDGDVQLCVRNAVLTPSVMEGATRGMAFDLSLSTGEHELCGTAQITIPYTVNDGEKLHAAYFNEKTGEWDPVCFTYDEQQEAAIITTDHLSSFLLFIVLDQATRMSNILFLELPLIYGTDEAADMISDWVSKSDPQTEAIKQFRSDMEFWKGIGIDGGWNLLQGLGFSSELVSNATDLVGHLGTEMVILDLIAAQIRGDDLAAKQAKLSLILNFAMEHLSTAIGTSAMSASMGVVGFIGVALNALGTQVQQRKHDLFDDAMHRFYTRGGSSCYRSCRDWYNYFYPAFEKGMKKENLEAYIVQSVRMYSNHFWEQAYADDYAFACEEVRGTGTYLYPEKALQDQLTEAYTAELLSGELVSVFTAIRNKLKAKAAERYFAKARDFEAQMNTKVILRFIDSSCKEGETSKYANYRVSFADIPETVATPEDYKRFITEKGRAAMAFTQHALITNKLKCSIILTDPNGEEKGTYEFQIPEGTGKVVVTIDLDTDGIMVDEEDSYNVKMEPAFVHLREEIWYTDKDGKKVDDNEYAGEGVWGKEVFPHYGIYYEDWYQDIKDAFYANKDIAPSVTGDINADRNGLTLNGTFDRTTKTGSGTFKLKTGYHNTVLTDDQLWESFSTFDAYRKREIYKVVEGSDGHKYAVYNLIMEGDIAHDLTGTFTVKLENGKYIYDFTADGTYKLDAKAYNSVGNPTFLTELGFTLYGEMTVNTINMKQEGKTKMTYRLKVKE